MITKSIFIDTLRLRGSKFACDLSHVRWFYGIGNFNVIFFIEGIVNLNNSTPRRRGEDARTRMYNEMYFTSAWRHQRPYSIALFVREMVRVDFDCRSRLRGFYGLLTVPALAAGVILICVPPCIIPIKIRRSAPVQFARRTLSFMTGLWHSASLSSLMIEIIERVDLWVTMWRYVYHARSPDRWRKREGCYRIVLYVYCCPKYFFLYADRV